MRTESFRGALLAALVIASLMVLALNITGLAVAQLKNQINFAGRCVEVSENIVPRENLNAADYVTHLEWGGPRGTRPMSYIEYMENRLITPFQVTQVYLTKLTDCKLLAETTKVFYILVNSNVYSSLQSSMEQYTQDLEKEGYTISVFSGIWGWPENVRSFLQGAPSSLVGCLLVGDIPVAWYEIENDYGEGTHAEFPIDLYFMDLNGTWIDADNDGIYDSHIGDVSPEIHVGRLKADTLTGDEVSLLQNYFDKNHEYRVGGLDLPYRALVYVDDDWVPWADDWSDDVGMLYENRTLVKDKATTNATDYKNRLVDNYQLVQICAHSWPGGHHFFIDGGDGGYVYSSDIRDIDPHAFFFNLFACSATRYIEDDYIGGWYLFSDTYGIAVVGSTKTGGMLEFQDFYGPLSQSKSLGEAFIEWFMEHGEESRSWFYGMTFLGDPTLCIRKDRAPPPPPALGLPANNAVNYFNYLRFSWENLDSVENTVPVTYHVQVDNNSDFSSPENENYWQPDNSFETNLQDGFWYWRVRARDNAGNVGGWSEVRIVFIKISGTRWGSQADWEAGHYENACVHNGSVSVGLYPPVPYFNCMGWDDETHIHEEVDILEATCKEGKAYFFAQDDSGWFGESGLAYAHLENTFYLDNAGVENETLEFWWNAWSDDFDEGDGFTSLNIRIKKPDNSWVDLWSKTYYTIWENTENGMVTVDVPSNTLEESGLYTIRIHVYWYFEVGSLFRHERFEWSVDNLSFGLTKAKHVTRWRDVGAKSAWQILQASSDIGAGEIIIARVEVSNDGENVDDYSEPKDLVNGISTYDISGLQDARYVRMVTYLMTSSLDHAPKLNEYVVTSEAIPVWQLTETWTGTIQAPIAWTGSAVFSSVNLYTVNVEKILDLYAGSKLVVKFYTYANAFENENIIENFSPPLHVEENEEARHPEGVGVRKARLDLTTDDTENVISTIASFTVRRVDLEARFLEIPFYWSQAGTAGKLELETEFLEIPFYWSQAPD